MPALTHGVDSRYKVFLIYILIRRQSDLAVLIHKNVSFRSPKALELKNYSISIKILPNFIFALIEHFPWDTWSVNEEFALEAEEKALEEDLAGSSPYDIIICDNLADD